ncbi:MAG: heme biosynthesis protein HemY [Acidiferrobacterales bacterium]
MKILIFFVLILFVAVFGTLYTVGDPGYVLIARAPWTIEMPLVMFVPLLIVTFIVLHYLWGFVRRMWHLPQDVSYWRLDRNTKRARDALTQGLITLAEGDWSKAHSRLLAGLQNGDSPLLNYLGAACASQALGDTEKRDEYLSEAQKAAPDQSLAVAMTQAHLYSWTEQHERALATLSELRTVAPKHVHILKLLVKTYVALHDWTSLAELIPDLRKNKVLDPEAMDQLELQVHCELLKLSLPSGSPKLLRRAWHAVPRSLRHHPKLLAIYSDHLIKQSQMNEAEVLLSDAIRRDWNEELVALYGLARSENPSAQLRTAEGWLSGRPDDPALLLTLGRLSRYNELWGKARSYLETSVKGRPTAETYHELGGLMEQLGETDRALDCYRRGLDALGADTPALPSPKPRASAPRQSAAG